jgi:hypothetical protein
MKSIPKGKTQDLLIANYYQLSICKFLVRNDKIQERYANCNLIVKEVWDLWNQFKPHGIILNKIETQSIKKPYKHQFISYPIIRCL